MIHPVKKVYITQDWGVDYQTYVRFGLKGHNGIDYRLYDKDGNKATKAEVFDPHGGKVIEIGDDADGYGKYIKIENDKEGSILAHLDSFVVNVGDETKEGQLIAIANNTGFSTAAHLHWGYYPKPRIRTNGYSGTINQASLLSQEGTPTPDGQFVSTTKQVVTDILLGMKGQTSEDEINGWVEKFDNPKQMTEEITNNDEAFRLSVAQPYIEECAANSKKALEEQKKDMQNAVNTAIKENNDNWQTKMDTANQDLKDCQAKKVEDYDWKELLIRAIKKFPN